MIDVDDEGGPSTSRKIKTVDGDSSSTSTNTSRWSRNTRDIAMSRPSSSSPVPITAKQEQHRILAACAGAIVTSLTMTPFDVVKTRLQTQTSAESLFVPSSHVPPPTSKAASNNTAGPSSYSSPRWKGKGKAPLPSSSKTTSTNMPSVAAMQHARSLAATNLATCCQKTYFTTNLADKRNILCAFDPREQTHGTRSAATSAASSSLASAVGSTSRSSMAASSASSLKASAGSISSRIFDAAVRNNPIVSSTKGGNLAYAANGAGAGILIATADSAGGSACLYPSPALAAEHLPTLSAPSTRHFNGFFDALVKIPRHEGITALWRGLSASLVMSVPAQVIYMVGYDNLRKAALVRTPDRFTTPISGQPTSTYIAASTFLAGSASRTAVAALLAPLELFRTRMQSTGAEVSLRSVLGSVQDLVKSDGASSLWRGLGATLWRDVPFSGIYWAGYEAMRRYLSDGRGMGEIVKGEHSSKTFTIAFTSGATSGILASFLTHPFDVIKTRRQTENSSIKGRSTFTFFRDIARNEGMAGLWSGIVPRVAKVAPACGIMIGAYEFGLRWAEGANDGQNDFEELGAELEGDMQ